MMLLPVAPLSCFMRRGGPQPMGSFFVKALETRGLIVLSLRGHAAEGAPQAGGRKLGPGPASKKGKPFVEAGPGNFEIASKCRSGPDRSGAGEPCPISVFRWMG